MIEIQDANGVFHLPMGKTEAAVVTTNGVIRNNGDGVMGKGQALVAKQMFADIEQKLGKYLRSYGNRVFNMGVYSNGERELTVITYPTKNHFREKSDLSLVTKSAKELKEIADKFGLTKVYLPPVGCGLGMLSYQTQVKPVLQEILNDDRFVVVLGYRNF